MGIAAAANLLVEGLAAAGVQGRRSSRSPERCFYWRTHHCRRTRRRPRLGLHRARQRDLQAIPYFLIINVYNFDTNHQWTTVHYEDNSVVSNGSWKDQTIAAFVLAGGKIAPPGFNPVKTLNNVVTYLNVNFQNDSTIFQGLGEGIAMNRDDSKAGLAVQCIVHRFSDNQIGAQGIDGSGSAFNSSDYYNNGKWVSGKNSQTSTGGFTVDCFTPAVWRER